jgi:hypothetical protein
MQQWLPNHILQYQKEQISGLPLYSTHLIPEFGPQMKLEKKGIMQLALKWFCIFNNLCCSYMALFVYAHSGVVFTI